MQSAIPPIMKLTPYLVPKVWGGSRLSRLFNGKITSLPLGEAWILAAHTSGSSSFLGQNLREYSLGKEKLLFGQHELPFLIKLIDTDENLSVQVHPDETYARKFENSPGKFEFWAILDARPGCGLYLGLKDGVSEHEVEKALQDKTDLSQLLRFHPVKKGDFLAVPPGSIHAIGEGVFLMEVQQNSDLTYRMWDWGRERELHTDKALAVLEDHPCRNTPDYFFIPPGKTLVENDYLKIDYRDLGTTETAWSLSSDSPTAIFVLEGRVEIEREGLQEVIDPQEIVFLPLQGSSTLSLKALKGPSKILIIS